MEWTHSKTSTLTLFSSFLTTSNAQLKGLIESGLLAPQTRGKEWKLIPGTWSFPGRQKFLVLGFLDTDRSGFFFFSPSKAHKTNVESLWENVVKWTIIVMIAQYIRAWVVLFFVRSTSRQFNFIVILPRKSFYDHHPAGRSHDSDSVISSFLG